MDDLQAEYFHNNIMTNTSKMDENYYVRGFVVLGKLEMGHHRKKRSMFSKTVDEKICVQVSVDEVVRIIGATGAPEVEF